MIYAAVGLFAAFGCTLTGGLGAAFFAAFVFSLAANFVSGMQTPSCGSLLLT